MQNLKSHEALYHPIYSKDTKFELIEGDSFRTIVYFEGIDVTPQVEKLILICSREMTKKQLMDALNLKDREYFRIGYLKPSINDDFIEMTIPEQPNHPHQKYRLTEKGRSLKILLEK